MCRFFYKFFFLIRIRIWKYKIAYNFANSPRIALHYFLKITIRAINIYIFIPSQNSNCRKSTFSQRRCAKISWRKPFPFSVIVRRSITLNHRT
ncbi:hypothetical protein FGO68_gene13144 [Halteria grandinella]|uniref:Uncharacterized protein n=1 Tax=Halteria grandinella TaxID=5974 RepID=A0A8J8NBJ6_HALGN|nr:hypothetical protein FGO68_gene13144 [Halteria grandinella]